MLVLSDRVRETVMALPWIVFAWQVIGAGATFRPMPGHRGASALSQLISLAFIALLVGREPLDLNIVLVSIGAAGLFASLVLFEWARRAVRGRLFSYIFSSDTPGFLCREGPFAYIRNPFYASYLLAMMSTTVIWPSEFRWLVVIAMTAYFTSAAVYEERKFARSAVASEYAQYKAATGRFLPRWRL